MEILSQSKRHRVCHQSQGTSLNSQDNMDFSHACHQHQFLTENCQRVFKCCSPVLCHCMTALHEAPLLSEKGSGPWRPVQGTVRTTRRTGQVPIKHHPNVPLLGHISVHCVSPYTPPKWVWHLPNSLYISFLQTMVPKAPLILHPKGFFRAFL